ncbi:MAG: hypothetical protein ACYSWZ_13030 [Planctomycetota bacterium]|jgi:hypothetical protein
MRKMVTKYQQTNGVFLMVICGLLAVLFAQCLAGEAKQPKMLKEF